MGYSLGYFLVLTGILLNASVSLGQGLSKGSDPKKAGTAYLVATKPGDKVTALGSTTAEIQKLVAQIAEGKEPFDTAIVNQFTAKYLATKTGPFGEQEKLFLHQQALVDYHFSKCEITKNTDDCAKARKELDFFVSLSKASDVDFKYTPQKIDIPTYDLASKKMTYQGVTYDAKSGKATGPDVKEIAAATPATPPARPKDVVVDEKADKPAEAGGYTCEWKKDLQRKILRGPSCNSSGTRICSGYVNCDKNGKKFTRLATCSEAFCEDSRASECSKQLGYGSRNPDADDASFTDAKATPVKAEGAAK